MLAVSILSRTATRCGYGWVPLHVISVGLLWDIALLVGRWHALVVDGRKVCIILIGGHRV